MSGTPAANSIVTITPPRPTNAIITLQNLWCIRQTVMYEYPDPFFNIGQKIPIPVDTYIWPALVWIDKATLTVGVTAPPVDDARIIIKANMQQDQSVAIPSSVGVLSHFMEDGPAENTLILAIVLWEQLESSDTPWDAVQAGFRAYTSSLQQAISGNLIFLGSSDPAEQQQGSSNVRTAVNNAVHDAIKGALSTWQKFEVWLGDLAIDGVIDDSSTVFSGSSLATKPFTVAFMESNPSNYYVIEGNLQLVPQQIVSKPTVVP